MCLFTLCAAAMSTPVTSSAARATAATTGPTGPARLATPTAWASIRRTSTRLSSTTVTSVSRCAAWLAGSSAGCRLPCYPHCLNFSYYLLRGGTLGNSSLYDSGSVGYNWASTSDGSSRAYSLIFLSGNIDASSYYRYRGHSVRCVAAG